MSDEFEFVSVALHHQTKVYHRIRDDSDARPECQYGNRDTTYLRTPRQDLDDGLRPCRFCFEGYTTPVARGDEFARDAQRHAALGAGGRALDDMDPDDFDARG